jgi:hypothetical protein
LLKFLERVGCVNDGILALVAHDWHHDELSVSRIDLKLDDATGPKRHGVGLHVADIRIIGAVPVRRFMVGRP